MDELGDIMPQPDKERKKVNQAGYDNADVEPFSGNYQQLYRELLAENRALKDKLEEYTELIRELYGLVDRDDDGEEKYEDFAV